MRAGLRLQLRKIAKKSRAKWSSSTALRRMAVSCVVWWWKLKNDKVDDKLGCFRSVFGLGWEHWCERLSIYCDRVEVFQVRECVWVGVRVLVWVFEYLLQWSWGFAGKLGCFGSVFELGWEHWCERLSIYCDGVGVFQVRECVWVGVRVLVWAFEYLLQWSWGFSTNRTTR